MPLYEYWCQRCQCKLILLLPSFSESLPPCPQCGDKALQRIFSTFSVLKTDKTVYEDILGDSGLTRGMLSNDPRALAEWNRRMSRGENVAPEYEEMLDKMERGEMPSGSKGGSAEGAD